MSATAKLIGAALLGVLVGAAMHSTGGWRGVLTAVAMWSAQAIAVTLATRPSPRR